MKLAINYRDDRVTGGDGEDIGAGDDLRADGLDLRLDGVDDVEASDGVGVGESGLLTGEVGGVGKQHRRVASLSHTTTCMYMQASLEPTVDTTVCKST